MGFFSNIFKSKDTRPKKYNTTTWYEYALRQEEKGNWQEAAECYKVIVERAKAHADAYYHLFICLEKLKRWDELEKYAKQFDDRLGYLHQDYGKRALQVACAGRNASRPVDKEAARRAAAREAREKQIQDRKQGFSITVSKDENGEEVKVVTLLDNPHEVVTTAPYTEIRNVESKTVVEEEPKPKITWPDKADFLPKPSPNDGRITLGTFFDRYCSKFPPYHFYDDEPEISQDDIENLQTLISQVDKAKSKIEVKLDNKNYAEAARQCEWMIHGGCWEPWPYAKLMEIYKGAGLHNDAEELRKYSIQFFTARRNRMEQQMLQMLAQQDSDTQDMVKGMMRDGKEIWYYRGLFKLYDPYPCIEEWERMGDLSK